MNENSKNGRGKKIRIVLAVCFAIMCLLFFVPWISSNMSSSVLTAYKNINGMNISQYASMLAELASGSNTKLIGLGLAALKFIYLLPVLAALSAALLLANSKAGAILGALTSTLHILLSAAYFLLPISYAELRDLMFITTPTLHIYMYLGVATCAMSIAIISKYKKAEPASGKNTSKETTVKITKHSSSKNTPQKKQTSKKTSR